MIKISEKLPKILLYVALTIALVILFGTAIALVKGSKTKAQLEGNDLRRADPEPQKVINMSYRASDNVSAFTELGQIRTSTKASKDEESCTMVVSPWFSYPEGDTVFYEELSQKDRSIKSTIASYFSSYTKKELLLKGEIQIKTEIKEQLNSQFVLGEIRDIYFKEYIFFE